MAFWKAKNPRELAKYEERRALLAKEADPVAAQSADDSDGERPSAAPSMNLAGMASQSAGFRREIPSHNYSSRAGESAGFSRPRLVDPPAAADRDEDSLRVAATSTPYSMMNCDPGFMRKAAALAADTPSSDYRGMREQSEGVRRAPPPLAPSSDYGGMGAQGMGFVRSAPSSDLIGMAPQSAGFVRAAPSSDYVGMEMQSAGFEPTAPSSNYGSMGKQSRGFVRPPPSANLPGMSSQSAGVTAALPSSDFAGMQMQPAGYAPPPVKSVSARAPARAPASAAPAIEPSGPEIALVNLSTRTAYEIEQETKKLFEVLQQGFITEAQYEARKAALQAESAVAVRMPTVRIKKTKLTSADDAERKRPRVVRVFLSSTFQDMQRERDALVKRAFTKLKKTCADRGIFFSEVDLRWGITEQQAERGEVLELCLKEIDNCRPYFVNMLGERYGYIPRQIPAELLEKYRWLPDTRKVPNEKSVTELEIIHGALNDISSAEHSLFYMRSEVTEDGVPVVGGGDNPIKLKALKEKVKQSNLPLRFYGAPDELADMVLEDLQRAIDRDFPRDQDPDAAQLEDMAHDTFAQSRTRVYVADAPNFAALDAFVQGDDATPLVISGEPGTGKSSLLANWVKRRREQGEEEMVVHYVGASSDAADHLLAVRRIVTAYRKMFEIAEHLPADSRELAREFGHWLGLIPAGSRLVLVIDAVNQIVDKDGSHELRWLPDTMPATVRIIISAASGTKAHNSLLKKKWRQYPLGPLTRPQKEEFITRYLGQFGKSFDQKQMATISAAPQTGSPLFLRALLEELRVHGVFEELNSRIAYYLAAKRVQELYERMLERLERDYGAELVTSLCGLLFVSRRGLSETELLDLLQLKRVEFSSIYLALQENLISRQGLLNFFHDYLRAAVQARYLSSPARFRDRLVAYFKKQPGGIRKADELPYQLLQGQQWPDLVSALADLEVFRQLYNKRRKFELMAFWREAITRTGAEIGSLYLSNMEAYKRTKPSVEELAKMTSKVARFLREMQKYLVAERLFLESLKLAETVFGEFSAQVGKMNYLLAECFWNQGKMAEARPYCERSLEIRERVLGSHHLDVAMSLVGLGEIFIENDDEKAKVLIERALKIRIAHFGEGHPLVARCFQNLAVIADNCGNFEEALRLCKRAIEVRERTLGPHHPHLASSFEALATIYKLKGQPQNALPAIRRALSIFQSIHGEEHTSTLACMEWLVLILRDIDPSSQEAATLEARGKKISAQLSQQNIELRERIAD